MAFSEHNHDDFLQETNTKLHTKQLIYKQTWERVLTIYARAICHKVQL